MRYSGIQPQYFPRLHYFARILNTDTFVLRDDAQFVKKHKYPDGHNGKSYQADTPIKQSFGTQFLSVTTRHDGRKSIKETEISYDNDWIESHLKTVRFAYIKSPNFEVLFPELEKILRKKYHFLAELNIATIIWGILHLLGNKQVDTDNLSVGYINNSLKEQNKFRLKELRLASESKSLADNLTANEKIVALIKEIGADEDYCGGTAVSAYMDHEIFDKNGIKITVQDWKSHEYEQRFMKQIEFIPNLSIIDLLMNCEYEAAVKIIKGKE